MNKKKYLFLMVMLVLVPGVLLAQITANTASEHLNKVMPDGSIPYYGFSTNIKSTYTVTYTETNTGHYFQVVYRPGRQEYLSVFQISDTLFVEAMVPYGTSRVYFCGRTRSGHGFIGRLQVAPNGTLYFYYNCHYLVFNQVKDVFRIATHRGISDNEPYIAAIGTSTSGAPVRIHVEEAVTSLGYFNWNYAVNSTPCVSQLFDIVATDNYFVVSGKDSDGDNYILSHSPVANNTFSNNFYLFPTEDALVNTAKPNVALSALENDSVAVAYLYYGTNHRQMLHLDLWKCGQMSTIRGQETQLSDKSMLYNMIFMEDTARLAVLTEDGANNRYVVLLDAYSTMSYSTVGLNPTIDEYPFVARQSGNHFLLGNGKQEWYHYSALLPPVYCMPYWGYLVGMTNIKDAYMCTQDTQQIEAGGKTFLFQKIERPMYYFTFDCRMIIPHPYIGE
ncbi:MAG: hypothetical protein K5864_03850 [Bacteroidales bacterium]|nr:hypothetical protein [Bacteroidales bacterium]